ncbi:hypothetical protein [Halorientalis sp. IM1011]|uniref:hypothetical protein n=1 Tax=Halorientalis sp. IM1011 TaxID=1932360 RepID=UPI0012FAD6AC|nr:hypothetical protein [Halorientalis sp. IM1011]
MTVCDDCGNTELPSAKYCSNCGTQLQRDMRDLSEGFLSIADRGHIQEAIDGNRRPPDGYHDRLHETVRHAFADFCQLNRWDEFDNRTALLGDLADGDFPEDFTAEDEALSHLYRLTCPFRFIHTAVGIDGLETLLEISLLVEYRTKTDQEPDADTVSVSIDVDVDKPA